MIQFLTYDDNENLVPFDFAPLGLKQRQIERWIRSVGADFGFSVGEISYILCNDEKILAVNRQFLQHDYYTDVITFDYGDIFISEDTVRSNAEMVGTDYPHELLRILIHGILHLTGQGDKTPETKAEMTRKEDAALSKAADLLN